MLQVIDIKYASAILQCIELLQALALNLKIRMLEGKETFTSS